MSVEYEGDSPHVLDVPWVILLGASGAGKTTVGRRLADELVCGFIDIDDRVSRELGLSMEDLILRADPRLEETQNRIGCAVLEGKHGGQGAVVAVGASLSLQPAIEDALRYASSNGSHIVHLDVDVAEVSRRMGLNAPRSVGLGAPRALLGKMLSEMNERHREIAHTSINTVGISPDVVSEQVRATL